MEGQLANHQTNSLYNGKQNTSVFKQIDIEPQENTQKDFERFQGDGEWLDEADLREKYKGKPDQAQNIIDKARSVLHPTRRVLLYEVLEFKSSSGSSFENSVQQKRTAEQAQMAKPPKQPKKEQPALITGEAKPTEPIELELAPSQREKLKKLLDTVEKALAAGEKTKESASADGVKDGIPVKVGCFQCIVISPNQVLLIPTT